MAKTEEFSSWDSAINRANVIARAAGCSNRWGLSASLQVAPGLPISQACRVRAGVHTPVAGIGRRLRSWQRASSRRDPPRERHGSALTGITSWQVYDAQLARSLLSAGKAGRPTFAPFSSARRRLSKSSKAGPSCLSASRNCNSCSSSLPVTAATLPSGCATVWDPTHLRRRRWRWGGRRCFSWPKLS